MNDNLLIQLLKIIKQSKQPIIKAFESDLSRVAFMDFIVLEEKNCCLEDAIGVLWGKTAMVLSQSLLGGNKER